MRVLIVLGAVACGETLEFPRACDESTVDGDCIEYTGSGWTQGSVVTECADGTILESCPEGAIGTCLWFGGTPDETLSYFYPQWWNGSQAAQQCASIGGTWTDL